MEVIHPDIIFHVAGTTTYGIDAHMQSVRAAVGQPGAVGVAVGDPVRDHVRLPHRHRRRRHPHRLPEPHPPVLGDDDDGQGAGPLAGGDGHRRTSWARPRRADRPSGTAASGDHVPGRSGAAPPRASSATPWPRAQVAPPAVRISEVSAHELRLCQPELVEDRRCSPPRVEVARGVGQPVEGDRLLDAGALTGATARGCVRTTPRPARRAAAASRRGRGRCGPAPTARRCARPARRRRWCQRRASSCSPRRADARARLHHARGSEPVAGALRHRAPGGRARRPSRRRRRGGSASPSSCGSPRSVSGGREPAPARRRSGPSPPGALRSRPPAPRGCAWSTARPRRSVVAPSARSCVARQSAKYPRCSRNVRSAAASCQPSSVSATVTSVACSASSQREGGVDVVDIRQAPSAGARSTARNGAGWRLRRSVAATAAAR